MKHSIDGPALSGATDIVDYAVELRETVGLASAFLLGIDDEASQRPRAPGKWCPREIIGHLIDSASNNHQRFVRAQFKDDLIFSGYEQDAWVSVQRYREAPWSDLVDLWRSFNLHIARVMEAVPKDERVRPRARHNLDEISWQTVPRDEPVSLDYFMRDYVGHLHHHLAQIGYRES
jgi:hypothetical protein